MRIFSYMLVVLAALGLGFGIARATQPPPANDIRLPLVANGSAPTSICDGTPLLDTDVGAISAMRDADGQYIVALQDRHDGSRARVMRHVERHLEDLAEPAAAAPQSSPAFSPPGPKQGALALVPGLQGEPDRLYYSERDLDDDPNEGPYKPRCLEF